MDDLRNGKKERTILGVPFDLTTYRLAMKEIDRWRESGYRGYVAITNPHSVMRCHQDVEMAAATLGADLVLPDGIGIIMAANILGHPHQGRVTGPDLMLRLCDWGRQKGYRHFFYGGAEGIADRLAERLSARFPGLQVAGTHCPPFRPLSEEEDREVVNMISRSRPDIVWVGLGAPKQEKWMMSHVGRVAAPVMIGVGAAFDFHSEQTKWAPPWIRRLGIEWAYRFALEPKRMWRRNLDSPVFLAKVVSQRIRSFLSPAIVQTVAARHTNISLMPSIRRSQEPDISQKPVEQRPAA